MLTRWWSLMDHWQGLQSLIVRFEVSLPCQWGNKRGKRWHMELNVCIIFVGNLPSTSDTASWLVRGWQGGWRLERKTQTRIKNSSVSLLVFNDNLKGPWIIHMLGSRSSSSSSNQGVFLVIYNLQQALTDSVDGKMECGVTVGPYYGASSSNFLFTNFIS